MTKLAFYRNFQGFSGGHLKVWDYFCHAKRSNMFHPTVYFSPDSQLDASNPWVAAGEPIESAWKPASDDALFLAGMDWLAVSEKHDGPVINLIQSTRHGNSRDPRYRFLGRRALRICVSQQVAEAIKATGQVNGPVVTIPAGLDADHLPGPSAQRDIQLLIVGLKRPSLARDISADLRASGIASICLQDALPRADFLNMLGRALVTVFLPFHQEGFYLPALEGMAMGTLVICPDCTGNRDFCVHELNCLMPGWETEAIVATCHDALARVAAGSARHIIEGALKQVHECSIDRERDDFASILSLFAKT